MRAGQTMRDGNNKQVALFPLESFIISQADTDTFSHRPNVYWATDYIAYNYAGSRLYRADCYAPVDLKCLWLDRTECVAVWESLDTVHLANGMIDYLTIIVYHDNDIQNGITQVGTIKRQGEVFNKTGTGGNVTGDHMHLETGYGRYNLSYSTGSGTAEYKYHITDYTTPKRLHNYNALFINDTVPRHSSQYPTQYPWVSYTGPTPTSKKHRFKWVLYARKLRDKAQN
jgi:hypothetical protein